MMDNISFIAQIVSAVASAATLIVLVMKVTRHITSMEGKISTQKAELDGKINVLDERIKNCQETLKSQKEEITYLNRLFTEYGLFIDKELRRRDDKG